MARGGYTRPTNPAPVSGPGALSRRTDGGPAGQSLPSPQYGQGIQQDALASAGPTGGTSAAGEAPTPTTPGPSTPQAPGQPTPGLPPTDWDVFGPTQRPDEPATAGLPFGPGPNGDLLPPAAPPAEMAKALIAAGFYAPGLEDVIFAAEGRF